MAFYSDMKILYHMLAKPVRGKSHAERMESFYGGQAQSYDDFRKRLLKGREELWQQLPRPQGGVWVDMGGGTGANLENFGDSISQLSKVYLVDLSGSLLKVAADRFKQRGWDNAVPVEADATQFRPPEGQADVVTFSYSLTMIPDWVSAMENAFAMLKPGGLLGVVDFYISRKFPEEGLRKHGTFSRFLWPNWFATDNVFPSPDHLPFLRRHLETVYLNEQTARLPYVPFFKTPYYLFIGRKPEA
ncbi:MAG: class I SAM-dependent methyltransferase [Pirellulaceae bacterium]